MAAAASESGSRWSGTPGDLSRANVLGTHALLEAVRRIDLAAAYPVRGLRRSVREIGTGGVTAHRRVRAAPPVTLYGSSKAAAERVACRYAAGYGLDIVRVRPFPAYGAAPRVRSSRCQTGPVS